MALNPHQKNKIDINSLSPEEQRLFRLYGKLPSRSDHFAKHLKDRKYFDSGDYAMSKAGKGDGVDTGSVGSQHPVPEKIPHLSSPPAPGGGNGLGLGLGGGGNGTGGGGGSTGMGGGGNGINLGIPGGSLLQQAGSPVKESSFLHRETSASDLENEDDETTTTSQNSGSRSGNPPVGQGQTGAIPIRR